MEGIADVAIGCQGNCEPNRGSYGQKPVARDRPARALASLDAHRIASRAATSRRGVVLARRGPKLQR
jgi:hypothetical protein